MKNMRYLSLFSGIEAATVAWKPLGWECVGLAEILDFQSSILQKHFPTIKNYGDVTKITEEDVISMGQIDVVIFGSPCQDMSVAGKRLGLETEKEDMNHSSILFFEGMRIFRLAQKHCGARFLVWENVPGALSSNKGKDFGKIINTMVGCEFNSEELVWRNEGICCGRDSLLEWSVLDAQWFGVAQRRRRLFIVLDTGDWRNRGTILLESESLRGNSPPSRYKTEENSSSTSQCIGMSIETFDMQAIGMYGNGEVASTLKARDYKDVTDLIVETTAISGTIIGRSPKNGGQGLGFNEHVMYTLTGTDHHAILYDETKVKCFQQNVRNEVRYINGDGQITGALMANSGAKQTNYIHIESSESNNTILSSPESRIRKLTPIECERLQGFPDDWTKVNDSTPFGKRINALGRSMAVPVIRWIGEQIEKKISDWDFGSIANSFDSHVREQLPWYDMVIEAIAFIIQNFASNKSVIYDIGSSTGNVKTIISDTIYTRNIKYITIDNVEEMYPDIVADAVE